MTGVPASARVRDAHVHLAAGAADLHDLDLRDAVGPAAICGAIRAAARARAPGDWIRGWGWDGTVSLPDAAPDHRVFLARRDGHAAWVNARARVALGLAPGDTIVREESFDAARRRLPARSADERMAALRPRLAELVAQGVCGVDDMVEAWAPEVYARLRDRGELSVSVGMWLPEEVEESEAHALRRAFPAGDPRLAVRGIKLFLDGTLEARTAALSTPYADDPGNVGVLRIPESELDPRITRWASLGWPVAVHAIGDRAVSLALLALGRAPRPRSGAHRIEHAQVVRRSDLPRFAQAGIVASVQPGHWRDDRPWLPARLGARKEIVVHPLASFARFRTEVVVGSDWPVSSWNPADILEAAVDPERGAEALDASEALAWYTSGPR